MPAAAVIPALIVYIYFVAVEMFVFVTKPKLFLHFNVGFLSHI